MNHEAKHFRCADLIILSCSFESVHVPLHVWSFVFFGSVVVLVSSYFTSIARASGKGSQMLRDPTLLSTNCGQRELVCTQRVHVAVRQSWERMLRTGRVCRSSEQPDDASPTIAICVCLDHRQHRGRPSNPKTRSESDPFSVGLVIQNSTATSEGLPPPCTTDVSLRTWQMWKKGCSGRSSECANSPCQSVSRQPRVSSDPPSSVKPSGISRVKGGTDQEEDRNSTRGVPKMARQDETTLSKDGPTQAVI